MKSIIEQASSIIKAIEKAWNRADNPAEFSIKIFAKEEKNFFGLTSKPAKIGIFFTEASQKTATTKIPHNVVEKKIEKIHQKQQPQPSVKKSEAKENAVKPLLEKTPKTKTPIVDKVSNKAPRQEVQKQKATWNTPMVDAVSEWLKTALSYINMSSATFSTEISGKYLRITFDKPLFETPERNKQLFRSFSYLITASLRNKFKQEVKDLKVVIVTTEQ